MAFNPETHKIVPVNMPLELYDKLKLLAAKDRRSVSAEICILVEEAIKKEAGS